MVSYPQTHYFYRIGPKDIKQTLFIRRRQSERHIITKRQVQPISQQTVATNEVSTTSPKYLSNCRLVGVGSSVPETILTNRDLEKFIDTSDAWITRRTGIRQRHILNKGEMLYDHGIIAAKNALEMAEIPVEEIDCILFATSSPDDIFGSACQVQNGIGAHNAVGFDVTAACSGFVIGLVTAAQYIRNRVFKKVIVIGGDALSRIIDWRDRSTCILFGDGCGAVVMVSNDSDSCALLGNAMKSDGRGYPHLNAAYYNNGFKPLETEPIATSYGSYCNLNMNGKEVFKWAVRDVPVVIEKALSQGNLDISALDWLMMHQANQRILDAAAEKLKLPKDKVISNLDKYGNTSAASIPIALDESVRNGVIKSNDVIAMAGFGAGLTIAAAIVRWL